MIMPGFKSVFLKTVTFRSLVLCACICSAACRKYSEGDFVPAARRGQFHQTRTQWHDLLGRHCPRLGWDQLVAVPIPQPKAFLDTKDTYKISFAFDGCA
ncbi:hypothetical protein WJX74_006548 [Apatococcus lobatus]|uniref:Secreted protein n=1 Tax=Apatococcus lobatus TaxID=904363 RepID=A0AAW1QY03_9CHLO